MHADEATPVYANILTPSDIRLLDVVQTDFGQVAYFQADTSAVSDSRNCTA